MAIWKQVSEISKIDLSPRKHLRTGKHIKRQRRTVMEGNKVRKLTCSPGRGQLECDGTRAEIIFRLSAKRTSPFKSARASFQSTTGSRGVRMRGSNAGYTMFRVSVKGTGYPLHSPVSPSLPLPCVAVCHHISTGISHKYPGKVRHPLCVKSITVSLV